MQRHIPDRRPRVDRQPDGVYYPQGPGARYDHSPISVYVFLQVASVSDNTTAS